MRDGEWERKGRGREINKRSGRPAKWSLVFVKENKKLSKRELKEKDTYWQKFSERRPQSHGVSGGA